MMFARKILNRLIEASYRPEDSEETRIRKKIMVVAALITPGILVSNGLVYLQFKENLTAFAYLITAAWAWFNLFLVIALSKRKFDRVFVWSVGLWVLPVHLLVALDLGNFMSSGGIILWGLAFPVSTGFLFVKQKHMIVFYVIYLANIIISIFFSSDRVMNIPAPVVKGIFAVNLIGLSVFLTSIIGYFVRQRDVAYGLLHEEQARSESLLLSILPENIAERLKRDRSTIADSFPNATILFADVVDFTPLSTRMSPEGLVQMLNDMFSVFDELLDKHGAEKIKTIGDCYMAAAGVPSPRNDHALAIVRLALDMLAAISDRKFESLGLSIRIGVNSGPVVAGVIGRKKFIYDLWGDAVNTASRMESHGARGRVQISKSTYDLVRDHIECESAGKIVVKGKGEMEVFLVVKEKS